MGQEERYSRQLQLPGFGAAAQEKLQLARVLVIGAGGLGVPALQYLAGMGVGTLGIMDGDIISLTNLHRQVLYSEAEIGQPKAKVAAKKLSALNSEINIQYFASFITPENALEIINGFDLVLDATDNFETRYLINDACVILKKPFIYGAVYQFEGQVSLFNLLNGPTYRCLYPVPPGPKEIPDCNTNGILGVVPGLIGLYQALEAIKVLTGTGKNLSGSLLLFDLLNNTQHSISIKPKPENQQIKALQPVYGNSEVKITENLMPAELLHWLESGKEFLLIDVREPEEYLRNHFQKATLLPLGELMKNPNTIPASQTLVMYCQTGKRTEKASLHLMQHFPDLEIRQLKGGLKSWRLNFGSKYLISC